MIPLMGINQLGRIAVAHLSGLATGLAFSSVLVNHVGSSAIAVGLLVPEVVVILIGRISKLLGTWEVKDLSG
jgi:hypothetical protein